ncbi:MAG: serine hydrolase domain-containing protein [Parachlamydiales bacterium]
MNFIRKIIFLILFIPFIAFSMSSEEIQKVMKECVDNGHTQGMVIGLIDESGTVFYKYGKMGVNDSRPIDENAIFETGSISKIFTSLLLAEMVNKKEVKLDDQIDKFLPSFVKTPSYHGKKVTLENLATHTAGFDYMPHNFIMSDMYNPFCEYSVPFLYDFLSTCELRNEPGVQYNYSNVGMGLLGFVLSLQANKEYEDLVVERILNPLGMDSTRVHLTEEMQERFAQAHIRDKVVPHWDIAVFDGAGGLHSSAKDLARFIEAYLGFYKTDLFPIMQETTKARHKQDVPDLDVGHEWNITYKYMPEFMYHGGATGGHQLFIGFCPETKKGVVICSNSCAYIYDIGKRILNDKWRLKKHREQVIITPMMLYKFIGEYKNIEDGSICKINMQDQGYMSTLSIKWGYYPEITMFSYTEKDFFLKVNDVKINFGLNENNDQIVETMKITADGKTYNFLKK